MLDKTCAGEEVGTGNEGSSGNFCIAKPGEDLPVPRESSGCLKEHTSVHLILLISLHSTSGLMDGV